MDRRRLAALDEGGSLSVEVTTSNPAREVAALLAGFAPVAPRPLFVVRRGKVPHGSDGRKLSGTFAERALQAKLMPLRAALTLAERRTLAGGPFDGVGIAFFPGCGVVGLDLDHCVTPEGKLDLSPMQREALKHFLGGAYVEVSMSGTGLHAFALGHASTIKANGVVELFGDRNFVALTGMRGSGVVA